MAIARAKNVGISARKLRRVMNEIRGKPVDYALDYLRYMPIPSARQIYSVVNAAAANAEHNDLMDREGLVVKRIVADQAPAKNMRRIRPKARGVPGAFNRPMSHITVEVDESPAS